MAFRKAGLLLGTVIGSFPGAWLATPVYAQEATVIDEVVVTARRREEAVQNVPSVIQAYGRETLEALGARDIEDIIGLTPGVEFVNSTSEPGNNDIIIRGGGAGRFINTDSSVGIYANGAYVSGGNLGGRTFNASDLFDLERVEVLKGPQGALLGRNALGGSVNVLSRRPDFETAAGELTLGLAQGEGRLVEGGFETPITDSVAIRVAGRRDERSEGFFYNPFLGRYTDRYDETVLRGVIVARLTDTTELTLQADHYEIDRGGAVAADLDVVRDPLNWAQDDENRSAQTQDNYLATLTTEISGVRLTAIANHRTRDSSAVEDIDQGVASAGVFDPTAQLACFSITSMMVATTPPNQRCIQNAADDFETSFYSAYAQGETGPVEWIVGFDYLEGDDVFTQEQSGRDVNSYQLTSTNDVQSTAIWGGIDWAVSDRLTGGLELRYTSEDKIQASRATQTLGAAAGQPFYDNRLDASFEKTTYAAHLQYRFGPDLSAYARVGSGFRSGGLNIDARDLDNPATPAIDPVVVPDTYGPETAVAYEMGLRSELFEGALRANLTAFLIEYQDILQNLNNNLTGASRIQYVSNTGDAEVTGAEVEFSGRGWAAFGGTLTWNLGAVTADSEITSGANAGRQVTRLPDWSVTGRATYRIGLGQGMESWSSLRLTKQWGGFTAFTNAVGLQEPTLLAFTTGIDWNDWSASLSVENLTDEDEPLNITSQNVVSPRAPSNWSFRLTRRF